MDTVAVQEPASVEKSHPDQRCGAQDSMTPWNEYVGKTPVPASTLPRNRLKRAALRRDRLENSSARPNPRRLDTVKTGEGSVGNSDVHYQATAR
jgi:hypothetical protein